jgi:2-dehydro-3-deoxyphosphogluconate aldolase/(4S)-4-hydroxy-2-oxoglutarate aldolase
MKMDIDKRIESVGLVPVVIIDDATEAVDTAMSLKAGGVDIMEITLRTDAGLDAIEAIAKEDLDILVGAGTVLSIDKAKESVSRGAQFIVSPGFDEAIVSWCVKNGIKVYPGCVTPTEIMAATGIGLDTVKFFPANIYGGAKAIKALSGPFPNVRFIPTGGVDLSNLRDFIMPQVLAVGGGWLCPRQDIGAKKFTAITRACAESANIIKMCR